MGSKKHKKESKKKKHRSRSRSPLDGEERERKRHKKHKDRKKDRSPDDSVALARGHRVATAPATSYERERENSPQTAAAPASSGGAQESLSIEETNRLRAKLGLKPLEVTEAPAEDGKFKDDLGEFYHKPAANLAQQAKTDKIKQKLEERREKRKLEQKLQVQTLGEGSDDEDALAWVKKSREIDKQKQEAAKRAAMLDEMDDVFGVGVLVAEDQAEERQASYSANSLKGLRVAHDLDAIGDERETILTLADKDVLADDAEDVLVNVNMVDDERYKKKVLDARKARAGYQAYDDEADIEAAALGYQKPILSKYDEEIDKEKAEKNKGFVIGDEAAIEAKRFRDMMRQERLQGGVEKRLESLRMPELRIASEYLDEAEINTKFKKPKKRGKMRKKAKEEPIDVDDYDAGAAPLLTDDTEVKPELLKTELAVDDEEVEPDSELQLALARARRMRQQDESRPHLPKVEELLERVKEEEQDEDMEQSTEGAMVLDATAEFCRTLGDIPTYGLAGNRDHKQEMLDFERDMELEPEQAAEPGTSGAWSRVDIEAEQPPDLLARAGATGLAAEPALGRGVAGALQLALSKGYLERAGATPQPRGVPNHLLTARNYSIEDKNYGGEDDKYGNKLLIFLCLKLDYVDDDGRPLCPKEAFRYLSHKFHGKGPGKNKQEKRIKKQVQEGLMKKMSSTDTPLNTLQMLQDKQRETASPYIVLSGAASASAKRDHAN
ncbi:SART-1 family domain-containing protein [Phthorimaea operculella]|nr:SART-1 family domain-containing protein [Phthorimaea operculella]